MSPVDGQSAPEAWGTQAVLPSGKSRPQVEAVAIDQRAPLKLSVCAGVTGPAECPTRRPQA